jgi:threonylcarbamoyladenosine tRNA methylthiotransferase MtaB
MGRHYDTALFADRINMIKECIPDAFIGVDVIAGPRGETPEEWEKSYRFIESLPITRLHVFPYSERPGTRALSLDGVVSQEEKHRRVKMLTDLSDSKLHAFMTSQLGMVRKVLWEQSRAGRVKGLTDNYLRVEAIGENKHPNTFDYVRLDRFQDELVTGSII